MVKIPELVGLALVAIMTLAFVGAFQPQVENGLSPVFWVCAGGALMIIFYRKWKKKQEEKEN
jgi:FtsH-binding integral membrane protein